MSLKTFCKIVENSVTVNKGLNLCIIRGYPKLTLSNKSYKTIFVSHKTLYKIIFLAANLTSLITLSSDDLQVSVKYKANCW